MFEITKKFEVSVAHKLDLPYDSKCKRLHGHNLWITVYSRSQGLNSSGMVLDFTLIKKLVVDKLDHDYLEDIEEIGYEMVRQESGELVKVKKNSTAERIAQWICMQINQCYRVDVQESEGNIATYTDDSVRRE